jgi:hypothetical protein
MEEINMGKQQYAQKVQPYVKVAVEELTQRYITDKRIQEKGDNISLLYGERKRARSC